MERSPTKLETLAHSLRRALAIRLLRLEFDSDVVLVREVELGADDANIQRSMTGSSAISIGTEVSRRDRTSGRLSISINFHAGATASIPEPS